MRVRHLVAFGAALALVGLVEVTAFAAPTRGAVFTFVSPSPAEGATLTHGSVSFSFTYEKLPQTTRALVCSISGPTSSTGFCRLPVPVPGTKRLRSGASFNCLVSGSYTFTLSLLLADGTTIGTIRHFTVSLPRHIYWANLNVGTIGRANGDGSAVHQSFITGLKGPIGMAVDCHHIYWADFNNETIGRANLDGSGVDRNFITTENGPWGVAVDSGHIYWTNSDSEPKGTIGRANLDGSGVNQSFITTNIVIGLGGLAVDSGHIYWTNPDGRIGRAKLDGSHVNESFITGADNPRDVTVDSRHVYWANSGSGVNSHHGRIGRAKLDGSSPHQSFITGGNVTEGVAVDSGHIYWTNRDDETVGRAHLNGSGVNHSFITVGPQHTAPEGVAVDPG